MRMKKFLILAAAAVAAIACSRTYDVNPVSEQEIGFGTWTETLTKAEARVQGSNTFLAGDTFAVYGYKDKSDDSAPQTVFDDVVVTASGSGTLTWDYSNHRFWDVNYDKYIFYAISPSAIGTGTTVDPKTGAFTSADITFGGDDNDILVANKTTVNKADGTNYFNAYGTVTMVFNHVASLVDVKVKKSPALGDATVTVTALSLDNIASTGKLTVSNAYNATTNANETTGPVATWASSATTSYAPGDGVNDSGAVNTVISEDTAFNASTPATPAASTDFISNLVVMPQTFDTTKDANKSQKLTITYTIAVTNGDSNTYTSTLWLADFDNVDDDAQDDTAIASWAPGKHYVFYLTIDAHAISFSAKINDWSSVVNGYNYLVN